MGCFRGRETAVAPLPLVIHLGRARQHGLAGARGAYLFVSIRRHIQLLCKQGICQRCCQTLFVPLSIIFGLIYRGDSLPRCEPRLSASRESDCHCPRAPLGLFPSPPGLFPSPPARCLAPPFPHETPVEMTLTLPGTAPSGRSGGPRGGPRYFRHLRSLDAFSRMMKVPEDLRTQSSTGGLISLVSFIVIFILFFSELVSFLTPVRTSSLSVDAGVGETLRIHLDVDFPHVNCEIMGVDALDVGGTVQLEITNHMFKTPIDHAGNRVRPSDRTRLVRHVRQAGPASPSPSPWPGGCGSCMGAQLAPGQCCNTCAEVRAAYEKRGWLLMDLQNIPQCAREGVTTLTPGKFDPDHGCNIHGHIEISKVAGRIHITPGHSFEFHGRTLHDLSALRNHQLDLSHRIKRLSFGEPYPGQVNPLDGVEKRAHSSDEKLGQHEYYIRIVPTTYKLSFARTLRTNQYSQSYYFRKSDPSKGGQLIPGLFFSYDLSPIHIEVEESRKSFFHFVVQLCAIIGGVFTVASMLSMFMDDVVLKAVRKAQTGKHI